MRTKSILLSLGCLTGCLDHDPDLGVEDSDLVGGTATSSRPEIGTFYNGASASCTATLIAPRAVIAAAHCLEPAYTATTVPAGAVYQFTDAGGAFRSYAVDRVQSFATRRFEYVPAGTFTTDLALLHLAATVPPSQAVPADLALQEPTTGAASTIFGFGCTDRTPASGGGFKQYRTFNFGTATTALCWGDSGGPALFGGPNDGGAIWGVNSDFNFVGGTDDWTDIFAAVPFYRKQIEDILHAWDGSNEIGWNRPGMDYNNFVTLSAGDCRFNCENDGRCEAFTWVPEGSAGRCWLKDGAPEPFLAWNNSVMSGVPSKYEVGFNRGGSDYNWFALGEARPELCAAACGRDHACQSWTYTAPSATSSAMCWLKNAVPAPRDVHVGRRAAPARVGLQPPGLRLRGVHRRERGRLRGSVRARRSLRRVHVHRRRDQQLLAQGRRAVGRRRRGDDVGRARRARDQHQPRRRRLSVVHDHAAVTDRVPGHLRSGVGVPGMDLRASGGDGDQRDMLAQELDPGPVVRRRPGVGGQGLRDAPLTAERLHHGLRDCHGRDAATLHMRSTSVAARCGRWRATSAPAW